MKRLLLCGCCFFFAFLAGCKDEDYQLRFSHFLHVEDNGMECSQCHGDLDKGKFARPKHDVCETCHEDIVDATKMTKDTCGTCHTLKNLKTSAYQLRFSHVLHVEDNGMECETCHGEKKDTKPDHDVCKTCHEDIVEATDMTKKTCGTCHTVEKLETIGDEKPLPKKITHGVFRHSEALVGACKECHADLSVKGKESPQKMTSGDLIAKRDKAHKSGRPCVACHENLDPKTEPENHEIDWVRRHGAYSANDETLCSVCHIKETCRECHQSQKPRSHNELWRLRTHGVEASWDRESCKTCHEEDFCVGCHRDTRPRSHNGSWLSRHCGECHSSEKKDSGCVTCHPDGIEAHNLSLPAGHDAYPDWTCLPCHDPVTGFKKMPMEHRFIEETECLNCHRY